MFRFKLPKREDVVKTWPLSYLADHLSSPGLWVLRRHPACLGISWGLFCCCLPIPFQMALASVGCIIWRINLPLSLAFVWVSNPITIPAFLYAGYVIGDALAPADVQMSLKDFESVGDITVLFGAVLPQLVLGSVVMGLAFAAVGYVVAQTLWGLWMKRRFIRVAELRRIIHDRLHHQDKAAESHNDAGPAPGSEQGQEGEKND